MSAGDRLPVDLSACRKILVVRLDFIGDWVLTLPFLAGLRQSAPQAEITAVVLTRVHDLARSCRSVDRVIAVEPRMTGPMEFLGSDENDLAGFVADYAGGGYDVALVPRWDADFNAALRIADASRARQVIGFSEECTPLRAELNRGEDGYYSAVLLDRRRMHEVEHKLGFLAAMGGDAGTTRAVLDLGDSDREAARDFMKRNLGIGQPFVAIAPFAVGRKLLPPELTAGLAGRLATATGLPLVVIGSPVHEELAGNFMDLLDVPAVSAVGLSLGGSAALIGDGTALVGMDSGPGHIAAALGTPVSVVFSHPTSGSPDHVGSPERFRPWGDPSRIQVIQPRTPLPPCIDGCDADEPHCITQLGIDHLYPPIADFVMRFVPQTAESTA
ncbi:MAG: glycosyltransferase family 9 protein [Bauldia sp.]|uniref:glycosyltransferase family 9 protein n=1 Tax=Bauldia sp. TaxID=2575872 RepID=UPI001D74D77A|nr:glycosyltransferase family 9 protein [Bauldia sp.]MCB1496333.1 glycosyltransferase family 9 protein [Bauldia sp.]